MGTFLQRSARYCMFCGAMLFASLAWAVSTVQVSATGPRAGETTLRLFDAGGKPVSPDAANSQRFSNLTTGTYQAEVLVGGKPVGQRTTVRLEDGDNQLRVDSATGSIEVIRRLARMQQQQQDGFEFGIFGGGKETPFKGNLRSIALNDSGSSGLKKDGTSFGVEARYNFRMLPELPNTRLFVFGGYTDYSGISTNKRFLDFHPTPGNDSGVAVNEKHSWTAGLGARWNFDDRFGLEVALGGHATRTRVAALSDESCCGGPDNRIKDTETVKGLMGSVGLRCRLGRYASGRPITGILRYTAMKMDDIKVTGQSPAFGFDYKARVDGGWNQSIQLGLTF
jgi:hypothetical protein